MAPPHRHDPTAPRRRRVGHTYGRCHNGAAALGPRRAAGLQEADADWSKVSGLLDVIEKITAACGAGGDVSLTE